VSASVPVAAAAAPAHPRAAARPQGSPRTRAARAPRLQAALAATALLLTACGTPGEATRDPVPDANPALPEDTAAAEAPPPVAVGPRRLAAEELRATLAALTEIDAAELDLPADTRTLGFDHLAGSSEVSGALVDALDAAAESVSAAWAARVAGPEVARVPVWTWRPSVGCAVDDAWDGEGYRWVTWRDAPITGTLTAPVDGDYTVAVHALQRDGLNPRTDRRLELAVDGVVVASAQPSREGGGAPFEAVVTLTAGAHEVSLRMPGGLSLADEAAYTQPSGPCVSGDGVVLGDVTLTGPRGGGTLATRCTPVSPTCVRGVTGWLAERVWRRPPDAATLDRLEALARARLAAGEPWQAVQGSLLHALLLSPRFALRLERAEGSRADGRTLAERLSLALWGEAPDEALARCADRGFFGQDASCAWGAVVERLLADPRADALAARFALQWLGVAERVVEGPAGPAFLAAPAGASDAAWAARTASLLEQARRDWADALREGHARPISALLDLRESWLDADLAAHYGLAPQAMPARAPWPEARGGALGHGALAAATSAPARVSFVLRGAWLRNRLLCDPPDPPPADVPALAVPADADPADALAAHVAAPACAACHADVDPWGLPLQAMGVDGRFTGTPREAELPDGTALTGPGDLAAHLLGARARDHRRCAAARLGTYLLGRPVDPDAEAARVAAWLRAAGAHGGGWPGLVRAIVHSEDFLAAPSEAP
jgi:hypothetical protein